MKIARIVGMVLVLVLAIGAAVPYVDAEGYRERIQNALERALNRKVTAGKVRFNLLTGPGFTVEDVTIEEDPRIGIEPIAFVPRLSARVRLATLWTRSLSLSNLRLSDPTVNLSKGDNGLWNFQLLLRDAAARATASHEFPSIQVRNGRINFKIGDYKTIAYLSDSDLDVDPVSPERVDIRFSGQPARTDQAAQNFGRLLGRGVWARGHDGNGQVDANIELERSGLSDLARLMEGHTIGVHGLVSSRAHVFGPIGKLEVAGQIRLDEFHRSDLLPPKSGGWNFKYQGTADLAAQHIELQTVRDQSVPFVVRFRTSDFLGDPKWAAMLEVKDAPVTAFLDVARQIGSPIPGDVAADGKVDGVIGYSRPGGVQGQFAVRDSAVRLRNAPAFEIRSAEVVIDGSMVRVGPGTVSVGDGQSADVEGSYDATSGAASLAIATRAMDVRELHAATELLLGVGRIPVLEDCPQGTWNGSLRFVRDGTESAWSGSIELHGARLDVSGLAEPVRVTSALVEIDGARAAITRLKGRVGSIPFSGEYRHDRAGRPDRARLDIAEADLAAIESLFQPTLRRDAGFLSRFRLRAAAAPEWLRSRRVDATVQVQKLTALGDIWEVSKLLVMWDGTEIRLNGIEAQRGDAEAAGSIVLDLSGASPRYSAEGKIDGLDYRGGTLTVEGTGDTLGFGDSLVAQARGSGTFSGSDLTLAPDAEFRSISGAFELIHGGRLKLSGIQAAQGVDSYSGQGTTQPDGRLVLELTSGKRQFKVALAK